MQLCLVFHKVVALGVYLSSARSLELRLSLCRFWSFTLLFTIVYRSPAPRVARELMDLALWQAKVYYKLWWMTETERHCLFDLMISCPIPLCKLGSRGSQALLRVGVLISITMWCLPCGPKVLYWLVPGAPKMMTFVCIGFFGIN